MELEVFVHGALCVAYSGQCLTSEALGGRSANRGQCAQACRLPYELIVDGERRIPARVVAYDLATGFDQGSAYVFARLGAVVVDSDREAKAALRTPDVRATLVGWWGGSILNAAGEVDRMRR